MAIRVNGRTENPLEIGVRGSDVRELYYGNQLIWPAEINVITGSNITVTVRLNLNQTSAGTWTYNWSTTDTIPSNKPVNVNITGGSNTTTLALTGDGVPTPTSLGLTTNLGTAVTTAKTENSWVDENDNTATTQTTIIISTVSAETVNVPFQLSQDSSGYWRYAYSVEIPVANSVTMNIDGTTFTVTGGTGTTTTTISTEPGVAPSATGVTGGTYYVQADNKVYTINPSITSVKPYDDTPYLSITPTFIQVGPNGYESQAITIQCNTAWTVTYSDSWIQNSLYPSGTGNGWTYAYATRNDGDERTGVITVTCTGGLSKSCIIYQAAAPRLVLNSGTYSYYNQPYTGRVISDKVYISGDTMWEVSSSNGMTITPSRGANGANIQITLPANASTESELFCYAYLRLVNNTGVTQLVAAYVQPNQNVANPAIYVTANNNTIDWNNSTTTVTVSANTTWQINSSLLSGITTSQCSPLTGNSGSTTVTITNLPNNTSYDSGVTYQFGATTTMQGASNVSDVCQFSKSARPDNRPIPSFSIVSNPKNITWSASSYEISITTNSEDSTPWTIYLYRDGVLYSGIEDPEGGRDTFNTLDGAGNMVLTIHTNQNTSTINYVNWFVCGYTTYLQNEIKAGYGNVSDSCTTKQGKKSSTPAPTPTSKYAKFVLTEYTFPSTGESYHTFTISASTSWRISQDEITGSDPEAPSCFTIEGIEQEGEITGTSGVKSIRVMADAFNGEGYTLDDRYMTIPIMPLYADDFNADGYNSLTLFQPEKPYLTINGSSSAAASNCSGATISRTFTTNSPWSASSLGWASMSPSQGNAGQNTVNIIINPNNEYSAKSGTITVTTTASSPNLPNVSANYSVSIPAKPVPVITPWLQVSPISTGVGASNGSITYLVSSNTTWQATENTSWLRIQNSGGSEGQSYVTVDYDANTGSTNRSATVTFTTTYTSGNVTCAATITQSYVRKFASFTIDSMRVTDNVTAVTAVVSANTGWTIECDDSMYTSTDSGEGGLTPVVFYFSANTSSYVTKIMRAVIELDNYDDTNYGDYLTLTIYQSAKDYTDVVKEVQYTFLCNYLNSSFKYYIFSTSSTPTAPVANYVECPMPCIHYGNVETEERQASSPFYNTATSATASYVINNTTYWFRYYDTATNTWSGAYSFVWKDAENLNINVW